MITYIEYINDMRRSMGLEEISLEQATKEHNPSEHFQELTAMMALEIMDLKSRVEYLEGKGGGE